MNNGVTYKPRRSKKTELVRYLPDGKVEDEIQSDVISILKALKPGDKVSIELEVINKTDSSGPVLSLIAKEGVRKIVSAYQLCKINSIVQSEDYD